MSVQVFVSHTRYDIGICDAFDAACAGVEVERYRSEFEDVEEEIKKNRQPAWSIIRENIEKSKALFLLVGRVLRDAQEDPGHSKGHSWAHTQNWISFEIGVACAKGIDVWVICDDGIVINFPVPYLNNYLPISPRNTAVREHLEYVLKGYELGKKFGINPDLQCDCNSCHASFNLRLTFKPSEYITCPQCLGKIEFPKGFGYLRK